jgi:hypothetical protein
MRAQQANISGLQSFGASVLILLVLVPAWFGLASADAATPHASIARRQTALCYSHGATRSGGRGVQAQHCSKVTAARVSHSGRQKRKVTSSKVGHTPPSTTIKTPPVTITTPPTTTPPVTVTLPTTTPESHGTESPTPTSPTESPPVESTTEPGPSSSPGTGSGWDGFGGSSIPGANWRPYASTSPFNQRTEGATVDPDSAAIVKTVLSWSLPGNLVGGDAETSEDWGHPAFYAEPGDPVYTLQATEPWGNNSLNGMRIAIPANARPSGSEDAHMTVVTSEGWEYDFWHTQTPPVGGGTLTFGWGGRTRIDGSGLNSGGTASGFGSLAGMIRAPELAAGHINHALFIVLRCTAQGTSFGYGAATHVGTSSYVYPADDGGDACPAGETNAPPLGTRFMLAMSDAQIQALAVPAWKKTILTALAHYGGYAGDTGGPGFAFMFESSTSDTALGLPDPLVTFAKANDLPTWEGRYVFNVASGVEWEKYLRVLTPPSQ